MTSLKWRFPVFVKKLGNCLARIFEGFPTDNFAQLFRRGISFLLLVVSSQVQVTVLSVDLVFVSQSEKSTSWRHNYNSDQTKNPKGILPRSTLDHCDISIEKEMSKTSKWEMPNNHDHHNGKRKLQMEVDGHWKHCCMWDLYHGRFGLWVLVFSVGHNWILEVSLVMHERKFLLIFFAGFIVLYYNNYDPNVIIKLHAFD